MKLPAKFASKLLKVSDFSDRCDVLVCVHLPVWMCECVCVRASVCVLFCVCPLDKAELIWPHTKKVRQMGRGAWPGTNDPRRVHRVYADCCCCCWAFTDASNCSRSCGDLKSTHLKANVTWNRLEIESQCRAALPPVPVPYQIYTVSCGLWLPPALAAACGCSQETLGHN